ncbi:AMP-dependent synthetase/ligase [Streptomyces griseocarneus]|uniref:AMP-dependent synthetase/ligase n=1 Tax=Streptomyces griseocarneus TaxID=51201 RepID=UPI00167EAE0F|nr:long-chain fatty acid--CoA ligase [Streptomyces griseocarneus]MBZ6477370.1 long-chain fatty acid--CoA ligase [Streptomyces griseocarneus]GHG75941.1 long-chain acyl-CoA synthetase [Streptomyces griseocarneus]
MERARPGTLATFIDWTAERYGELPALRFRSREEGGGWTETTFTALREEIRAVGRGLIALGVRPDDRVAIVSETRPEWTIAQFGALTAGAAVVPVYPTAGEDELVWVLGDSGASVVVCEDAAQAARVAAVRAKLPALRHVVLMDTEGCAPGELALRRLPGGAAPDEVESELEKRSAARRGEDLCTVIYTSGTTGLPKGCRLTHANIVSNQDATAHLTEGGPGSTTYLYLPLAHVLGQIIQLTSLRRGGTLAYFGGKVENVVAELAEVRPTHLPSVPRLFEKIHAQVVSLAEAQGPAGRARLEEAIRTGVAVADLRARGEEPAGELRAAWETAEESLFSLVRAAFGGRLRWALTGAAPIAPQTLDFLRACGIDVYEGYGMTEGSGVITVNHRGAVRPGTVGRAVEGSEVRIAGDGEVLARGPGVFAGYHGNPSATAEAVDADGWLHTGDLGTLDADGYLTITGRKKDLIITSSGKNLAPSPVEFAIQQSRFVSRAVMVGDRRPYAVALLTLDAVEVEAWAAREGVDLRAAGPARHPQVRRLCQEAVDAANARVARPARIRAFAILNEDFSVENGELTPTLKLRRAVVGERYAAEIDALYERGDKGSVEGS